ncbi:TPA: hypothetical protein U5097_001133 [Streptococcus agalactiae]|uniref:hypothetical protein n=1 Tax=Streptococcus agalactiae TaxID=1311 RepID=UPI0002BA7257|nr:hypothetical protein [Streptococcus agalactiae]AWZ34729.1 hypothetical protein CDH81_08425 [Streptococcus agalactiae]EPT98034.1 hypothetical protein SAG0109_03390 [Streptococcus agalactiae BSU108]MCC9941862.1 hypothetical protein [Streptococcus agalactiae]HEN4675004.1 hypothetical protein [Streptococcus agalactiae]HEN4681480.1 hypothetical protein [Streptococcus agalactiae]
MRIKDYADSKGVSTQSIYKRIRSPKYRDRLKGHLYKDNQKVENLDLIGIKILEDYPFEQDILKLEKEKNNIVEAFEKLELRYQDVFSWWNNSSERQFDLNQEIKVCKNKLSILLILLIISILINCLLLWLVC